MNYPIYDVTSDRATPINVAVIEAIEPEEASDNNHNNRKRLFSFLRLFGFVIILIIGGGTIYALTQYFTAMPVQESDLSKSEFFAFQNHDFFPERKSIRPGDIAKVDTVFKSDSSIPMYVFIRILMPLVNGSPLYVPIDSNGQEGFNTKKWEAVEGEIGIRNDRYSYVYALSSPLAPLDTTLALMEQVKMVEMDKADYGKLGDINIKIRAYGAGVEDNTSLEDAWSGIKQRYSGDF